MTNEEKQSGAPSGPTPQLRHLLPVIVRTSDSLKPNLLFLKRICEQEDVRPVFAPSASPLRLSRF